MLPYRIIRYNAMEFAYNRWKLIYMEEIVVKLFTSFLRIINKGINSE